MAEGHGNFVWYDLMTSDTQAATAFYKEVIGWDARDSGLTDRSYLLLSINSVDVGGLMPIPPEATAQGARATWMGYVAVDDVDVYASKGTEKGGTIVRGPEDIPFVGRFAVANDPHGATIVLFKATGGAMPAAAAPGTPGHVGWAELHAGDLATEWPFYQTLFSWTETGAMEMGPMGVYRMFATDHSQEATPPTVGGMMTKMPETPAPFWLYYINVEAVDAAVARATGAGAQLISGPMEVPGGQWIAQFIDPQGAIFAVVAFTR